MIGWNQDIIEHNEEDGQDQDLGHELKEDGYDHEADEDDSQQIILSVV